MLEPVVQIVHYSDIHLAGRMHAEQRQGWGRMQRFLPEQYQQGLARADRPALEAFCRFLQTWLVADPAWRGVPVWLVDTGDGTAFGETESLEEWMQWSRRIRQAAGPMAESVQVYGNHDAWPGVFPLREPWRMAEHRDLMRRHWFRKSMPEAPLSVPIPGGGGARVEIYTANTVDHRPRQNAMARGVAAPDLWWEPKPAMVGPTPAHDIERMAGTFADDGLGAHFRILATHYPVARDANPHRYVEQLANRDAFAGELATRHRVSRPLVHLLLSGHTHAAFPEVGQWPAKHTDCLHAPLAGGTCQVVAGTLSQRRTGPARPAPAGAGLAQRLAATYPFQFNWLRIQVRREASPSLVVERQVAMRGRAGPFFLAPVADGQRSTAQQMQVPLGANADADA